MRTRRQRFPSATGHSDRLWPVLVLLVLLILVPTACVLWFMNAAVRNERLAVREKLRDAYRGHLMLARNQLEDDLRRTLRQADQWGNRLSCAQTFEMCVRHGLADGVVCIDDEGHVGYPSSQTSTHVLPQTDRRWQQAAQLEYIQRDYPSAAQQYMAIAQSPGDEPVDHVAQAWQAAARCLVHADRKSEALDILTTTLTQPRFAAATDQLGRLIVADALLRALELLNDPQAVRARSIANRLADQLTDYSNPKLSAAQRRFLMKRLSEWDPRVTFPTLAGEWLAARFFEFETVPTARTSLAKTKMAGVWQIATPSGRRILLLEDSRLRAKARQPLTGSSTPAEIQIDIISPTQHPTREDSFLTVAAGPMFPDWRLSLTLDHEDVFADASRAQVTSYFWIGTLAIVAIAGLVVSIGRSLRNQSRLASLKNDLVATITHELKTPLASMRLLVDTLVDQPKLNEPQVREYLQLIGDENMRLSRLIDNFLAFSRIERNRYRFDFSEHDPAAIVASVVKSVQERFDAPSCDFRVRTAANLPPIVADPDAIVTVLLNLLDNAYKYSGDQKKIFLNVTANGTCVEFEVEDQGIGMTAREQKRIFRQFYQINQRLSRSGEGCGLGLSIVQYIVSAHGGTIHVDSQPDRGSRFRVAIPKATNPRSPTPTDVRL